MQPDKGVGDIAMATADLNSLKQDLNRRMDSALETLRREFAGLRTGRAHPGLLEPVKVIAYGTEMPLNQVGTIGTPEPRMLTVQVWDKSMVSAVEKAIRDSGLGLKLAKMAHKYAEGAKISVRGVRRDGMEQIKGHEKKHEIGEDLAKDWSDEVQKLTDQFIKKVDEALVDKEKDIRQV
jgi:ribosome recycling factor